MTWNNIRKMVARAAEILVTFVTSAVWFVSTVRAAVRRGFVRQKVQEHRTCMLSWMFALVHLLVSDAGY